MSGTQPNTFAHTLAQAYGKDGTHVIVREFRGAQLVLVSYDGRGGFVWRNVMLTNDKNPPAKYPHSIALRIADKASREYGAKCAVLDQISGTLTQPASAVANDKRNSTYSAAAMAYLRDLLRHGYHDSIDDAIVDARHVHKLTKAQAEALRADYLNAAE